MTTCTTPEYPPGVHIIPPPLPLSPSTNSIRLNHLMLRIKDPTASLRFYNDCLGLHTVFIFNTGAWTIYYLGPRDVGMHNLGVSKGLLELYYVPSDSEKEYRNGNEDGGTGFGHLGFTVPDVESVLERVREFGFEVIKPLGEVGVEQMGVNKSITDENVAEGYKHVFRQLAFVKDPDGYWVELVPQVVQPPPS